MWQVALNLNISTYEDVLSSIKSDWDIVSRHLDDSTTLSELRQVEILLDSLESKLGQFKELFPKVEPKRSLLNLGGTVLRTLFGTATMTDLHRLHEAMGELQDRNAEVAHSLSKQVTYIRNLKYRHEPKYRSIGKPVFNCEGQCRAIACKISRDFS